MVLLLLVGTHLRLLVVELLTTSEHFCPGPLKVSLWNDLSDHVLDGVGLADFKSRANVDGVRLTFSSLLSLSFSFFHGLVVWAWGLRIDKEISLSPDLALLTQF